MKIRRVTKEYSPKASALLRQAFPGSTYEERLVENLRRNGKVVHEWVGIHINRVVSYIAFSNAYNGSAVVGLHLAPLAVNPEFQRQGIGSEMLRFALRQDVIKEETLFVLGDPGFYQKFGFAPCSMPCCPFSRKNGGFLTLRNHTSSQYIVGYEAEFGV